MRKSIKRALSSVLGVTTALTTLFQAGGITTIEAQAVETNVDKTVKLSPANASVFNDTDGDGFGEFQGFGTSLCWWANRVGYSDELTRQAAEAFYNKETGLGMTIGRYNIGGGDNVGESPEVSVNEKAAFYDTSYEGLTYAGSKMAVSTNTNLANATYSKSDADFGITSGKKVGSFDNIGWINNLDGEVGSGDNLHYIVNAIEDGKYTVKMLFTLAGSNQRGVSIKVTPESAATYEHKEEGNGAENITDISEDEIKEESSEDASFEYSLAENNSSAESSSAENSSSAESSSAENSSSAESSSAEEVAQDDKSVEDASASTESSEKVLEENKTDEAAFAVSSEVSVEKTLEQAVLDEVVSEETLESKIYTVPYTEVNNNLIASGNNNMLFVVTFSDVELKAGSNKIDIGGADGDWCLDFVKMAIIKSGDEGVLPESSDFLHGPHITRSDSVVPGYATDVTKINLEAHDEAYYTETYARADFDCGYAWNYDWDADKNQLNVLT
ncbi:MAG: xylosidase/arabinofuranosidase, partial [Butyrivibrio sp.]|nr:xylosidase/arabinofuranosidase [Butyrivibrio sp.]